jgi:uncharacterized protein (DUF1330 family)
MPAYLIANIEVQDPVRYRDYVAGVPATLAKHGGRYLARGGAVQVLEGGWTPNRLVIVEFPDAATARAWWESADYAELRALRQSTTNSSLVVIEGL